MTRQSLRDELNAVAVAVADSVYQASVYSVFACGGAVLLLVGVGAAVWLGAVGVPAFHPR